MRPGHNSYQIWSAVHLRRTRRPTGGSGGRYGALVLLVRRLPIYDRASVKSQAKLGFVHFASRWSPSRAKAPGGQSESRWSFLDVMFSADVQKPRRNPVHPIEVDVAHPPGIAPNGQSGA